MASDSVSEERRIIAMGGGGFTMEPGNPLLDEFILGEARSNRPKICFLPTASGDNDAYLRRFYETFSRYPCEPSYLSLFRPPAMDMGEMLLEQDILYVGGGNTVCLLALWKGWGLDRILRRAWERGVLLCGLSSGSICWFASGVTDSLYPGRFLPLECLGFLPDSHCPHYDSEPARQPMYQALVQAGKLPPGYACEDGVALCYRGTALQRIVSSRPDARAYHLQAGAEQPVERQLEPEYLGA